MKKGITHYKNSPGEPEIREMLQHSNWIEREMSSQAMDDAIAAWTYAVRNYKNMTTKYILKIHKLLLRNVRPDIAGKFRQCDVYIGGECRRYISDEILMSPIKKVLDVMADPENVKLDEEMRDGLSKNIHVVFEKGHPFEDGNGRVGRILYNIHRLKLGLPIHIIHEGDEQLAYYEWFRE